MPNSRNSSVFDQVLNSVGSAIARGEMGAGAVQSAEQIVDRTGASRSIVRESIRVLVSLGMLRAGRRVGLTVLPREQWNLLDPQIVRWRLTSPDRLTQVAELRDIRLAVEPEAARIAATRRNDEQSDALLRAGSDLIRSAELRNGQKFISADQRIHRLVFESSDSPMLVRLHSIVKVALPERTPRSPTRWRDSLVDASRHFEMAQAIADMQGDQAAFLMRGIIEADGGELE
jgi:DNA-binding FadR family transcriptional regulator